MLLPDSKALHTHAQAHMTSSVHAKFLQNFITTTQKKDTLRIWCTLSHANISNINLLLLVFNLHFSQCWSMEGTAAETSYCAGSVPLCLQLGSSHVHNSKSEHTKLGKVIVSFVDYTGLKQQVYRLFHVLFVKVIFTKSWAHGHKYRAAVLPATPVGRKFQTLLK